MKTLKICGFLTILFVSFCSTAFGQWGLLTLDQLSRSAPVIVLGTVEEIESEYGEYLGRKDFIFTYARITIQKPLKGTDSEHLMLRVPGGQIGERIIAGEQTFELKKMKKYFYS